MFEFAKYVVKGFKEFYHQSESTARKRRAMGIYPPQADDVFVKPPYSQSRFCQKVSNPNVKLFNIDPSKICGKKD